MRSVQRDQCQLIASAAADAINWPNVFSAAADAIKAARKTAPKPPKAKIKAKAKKLGKARPYNKVAKQEQYRQRIFGHIIEEYGPNVFYERQFLTLGGPQVEGGNLVDGTELHHLHRVGLFDKGREGNYISVERDQAVHTQNCKYQGPVWERGSLRSVWLRYCKESNFFPAVVHADFCFGMKAAKPTIFAILENPPYLPVRRLCHSWQSHTQSVLLVINVLKKSAWVKRLGNKIDSRPRHGLERMVRFQTIREMMSVDLVDSFSYNGTNVSKMQTMIYRLAPR